MSVEPSLPSPRSALLHRLARAYRIFCYVLAATIIAGMPITYAAGFRIVTTPSVPEGLWWVHPGSVDRFTFVNTCLPRELAEYGRKNGYLESGSCPGRAAAVMKMVVALPGDHVSVGKSGISVNGRLLADSLPQVKDHFGKRVRNDVPFGDSIVPLKSYWLLGLSLRSWDSRYYGAVSAGGELGIGTPIFITLTPAQD